jgi:hypothetical protein
LFQFVARCLSRREPWSLTAGEGGGDGTAWIGLLLVLGRGSHEYRARNASWMDWMDLEPYRAQTGLDGLGAVIIETVSAAESSSHWGSFGLDFGVWTGQSCCTRSLMLARAFEAYGLGSLRRVLFLSCVSAFPMLFFLCPHFLLLVCSLIRSAHSRSQTHGPTGT